MRGNRLNTCPTGTMRTFMTTVCKSVVTRSICSRVSVSSVRRCVVPICPKRTLLITSSPTKLSSVSNFSISTRTDCPLLSFFSGASAFVFLSAGTAAFEAAGTGSAFAAGAGDGAAAASISFAASVTSTFSISEIDIKASSIAFASASVTTATSKECSNFSCSRSSAGGTDLITSPI